MRPGPRPIKVDQLKTSVRVLGADQVDEYRALCALLGRRPHQLAADLVLEGIERYRRDPELGPAVRALVDHAREYRAEQQAHTADNVIPFRIR